MIKLNNKGVLLVELLVSIGFIMIICVLILSTTINYSQLLNEKLQLKKFNEEKAIIYKDIATSFSTKIIKQINYNNNKYNITYIKPTITSNDKIESQSVISLDNNTLYIDNQKFESNDYYEYTDLKIIKMKSNTNNDYYIKLIIEYNYLGEEKEMSIYYVNDPIENLNGIGEKIYE